MSFKMKYTITNSFITSKSRPQRKALARTFGVVHDTGNLDSTAARNRNHFQNNAPEASAHGFVDDKEIIMTIPMDEEAWHVRGEVSNANTHAVGHELCYFSDLNRSKEAYKRFVWLWAYTCHLYGWDPHKDLRTHQELDPSRRSDPINAFSRIGVSWKQFLDDVKNEINDCREVKNVEKSNEPSSWAEVAWDWAVKNGLIDGTRPREPVTREELVTILYRFERMQRMRL